MTDTNPPIPWPLRLETDRLILRPFQPKDFEAWCTGLAGRLPQQYPYDEGPISLESYDEAWFTALCQRHQEQARQDYAYIFGIFCKGTQRHLGHADLSTIQRAEKQWANLGYGLHNQYWRQGFAQEAVRVVLRVGFQQLGYHRIEAAINLDNYPSMALATKVGLQRECVRRGRAASG
ncbi:MAG TPA: GNAT family N-acetyltransferase, partial [Leptolyngbyaceae cyanobacterium M65_K2018_010]|nr:GNAT family N-acetyltransferase [Leptolyngbyaceae cyanobacterium M65_K2018_010]